MTFVNYKQLLDDLAAWEPRLPEVDAFVGVPRSGMIAATWLALRRNVRLVPLNLLETDPAGCIASSSLRGNNLAIRQRWRPDTGTVMIVDDSCNLQTTMWGLRQRLRYVPLKIYYAAVYRSGKADSVDFCCREIPQPRMFEWNFFRHFQLDLTMWDMDGAICADWVGQKEKHAPAEYQQHLAAARPYYVPERSIYAVCTNRLPRWRTQTQHWLARYHVDYQQLLMSPYQDHEERDNRDVPRGTAKGKLYKEHEKAQLFVESDVAQAEVIARCANKLVLALDVMRLV